MSKMTTINRGKQSLKFIIKRSINNSSVYTIQRSSEKHNKVLGKDLDKLHRRRKEKIERIRQKFAQNKNMIKRPNRPAILKPELVERMKNILHEENAKLELIKKRQRIANALAKQNIMVEYKDMHLLQKRTVGRSVDGDTGINMKRKRTTEESSSPSKKRRIV